MAREHGRQRGQTLPAVMVIMVLLSLIAGGLAIAVSGALSQQAVSKRHVTADLAVQNGIEVAAARVQHGDCVVPPASPLKAASAPRVQSTHLPNLRPTGAPQILGSYCVRADHVDTEQLKRQTASSAPADSGQQTGQNVTCLSSAVPFRLATEVVVWLQLARSARTNEKVASGLRADKAPCSDGLPNASRPATALPGKDSLQGHCGAPTTQRVGDPALTQVGFVCYPVPGQSQLLSLYLGPSLASITSITVWMAPGSPQGGSVTMVAAPTGGVSPAYEQALLAITGSGTQLLYEEPLR